MTIYGPPWPGVLSITPTSLDLAYALWQFWLVRRHWSEGRAWITDALARIDSEQSDLQRAKALNEAGTLNHCIGDYAAARLAWEESLSIWRKLEDRKGMATALDNLGVLARTQGELERARALHSESLAVSRDLGHRSGMASTLNNLGIVALDQCDYEAAYAYQEESLAIKQESGDQWGAATSLVNLGLIEQFRGRYAQARSYYERGLSIFEELKDRSTAAITLLNLANVKRLEGEYLEAHRLYQESLSLFLELDLQPILVNSLEGFACLYAQQGSAKRAVLLFGVSSALREVMGTPLPPSEQAEFDLLIAAAKVVIGNERFDSAWAHGRSLNLEQAIAYVQEEPF